MAVSDVKDPDGNSVRVVRRVVADHPLQKGIIYLTIGMLIFSSIIGEKITRDDDKDSKDINSRAANKNHQYLI